MEIFKAFIGVALMMLGAWWFFFSGMMTACDSLSDKIIGKIIPIVTGIALIFFAVYIFML